MNRINMTNVTKTKIGFIAILVAIFGGGGKSLSSLHAQTFIVSNLGEATHETTTDEFSWSASSFTTGSQAVTFEGLITRLSGFGGGDEFISIYNNSSTNSPGSEVLTFGTPTDLGSNRRFQFTPSSDFELAADTTYWVVFGVNKDSGEDFENYWTSSTSETGTTGWSMGDNLYNSSNHGTSWMAGASGAKQFGIVVPEPSEYAFAIGLMLIAFVAFRRMQFAR